MKVLITGASGLLGAAVAESASRRGHETIGIIGRSSKEIEPLNTQVSLDLTDPSKLERLVLDAFPDAIVNCAAISDPGACERDPTLSQTLNVEVPGKLALLARHLFGKFVHLSSDLVFDGKSPPYRSDAQRSPTNLYGRQKAESESRTVEIAPENAIVLRLPLLNGNSPSGRRSLHETLFSQWASGNAAPLFTDEIRQPCLVNNVADAIVELLERDDLRGLFHWAGSEPLSRYAIGSAILEHFKLPPNLIEPSRRNDRPEFANRPPDLSLDCLPLAGALKTRQQSLAEQLESLIVPPPFRDWYHSL